MPAFCRSVAPFVAGLLYALAFAPFSFSVAAFLALWILLASCHTCSPRAVFYKGLYFGLGAFGLGVSWIFVSIHEHGPAPVWLAGSLTALFISFLTLLQALGLWLWASLWPTNAFTRYWFGWPLCWVAFEGLRAVIFGGFPWLLLGTSQIETPLSSFAPLGSVWLVSFVSAAFLGLLFSLKQYPRSLVHYGLLGLLLLSTGFLYPQQWTKETGPAIELALVQGNIPQSRRWDDAYLASIVHTYTTLTRDEVSPSTSLVIWPESAIPLPIEYFTKEVHTLLAPFPTRALITGTLAYGKHPEEYFNAVVGLGTAQGVYFKEHLVPFGEFVPLQHWLRGIIDFFNLPRSAYTKGPEDASPITTPFVTLGCAICYEIAFPGLVKERLGAPNEALLTVSNDAWFGHSFGPYQHLELARMRALETGRYVLRATNHGISAIISPKGKLLSQLGLSKRGVLCGTFFAMRGNTPWLSFGYLPLVAMVILWSVVAFFIMRKSSFKAQKGIGAS